MIKKITLIILLFCAVISCGKKGDPKYVDPDKKVEIKEVLIKDKTWNIKKGIIIEKNKLSFLEMNAYFIKK